MHIGTIFLVIWIFDVNLIFKNFIAKSVHIKQTFMFNTIDFSHEKITKGGNDVYQICFWQGIFLKHMSTIKIHYTTWLVKIKTENETCPYLRGKAYTAVRHYNESTYGDLRKDSKLRKLFQTVINSSGK